MSNLSITGGCLCGGVRFLAAAETGNLGLCHCKMCRRWGGGLPLTALHASVELQKEGALSWWKSSGWGERGFCAECGSSLFWRPQGEGGQPWSVSAGALDDESALQIVEHIFYDDKAGFYETTDDAARHSGVEFTAKVLRSLKEQHGEEFLQQALAQLRAHSGDEVADAVGEAVGR